MTLYPRNRKQSRRNLLAPNEESRELARLRFAMLSMADELESVTVPPESVTEPPAVSTLPRPASVFISYSHRDAPVVLRLQRVLEGQGVDVHVDSTHLYAGEPITEFIHRSIRATDLTFCLVSSDSLLSEWVALETLSSLWDERSRGERRFVAGYLDDGFFAPGFRLQATRRIDARLEEIDHLVPDYLERRLDTDDLNRERSRLLRLRTGLGEILERLKESFTLDLREPRFEESVAKLVALLRGGRDDRFEPPATPSDT